MPGDVKARVLLFPRQYLGKFRLRDIREQDFRVAQFLFAKQPHLPAVRFLLRLRCFFQRLRDNLQQLRALSAEEIKGAALNQTFQGPLVDLLRADASAEIIQ